MGHPEGWRVDLVKGKRDRSITLHSHRCLREPEITKNLGIKASNDGFNGRSDAWQFVAPSGKDSIRSSDSPNLAVELREIKPMECRRHGHQVNRGVREWRPISQR